MRPPGHVLETAEDWCCPNCDVTDVTRGLPANAVRFHVCPGLHMLSAPLVRAGVRCKVEAAQREAYLDGEVQAAGDDGKPYMNVRTTRDDGEDLLVNAGLAQARLGDYRLSVRAGQFGDDGDDPVGDDDVVAALEFA